jgi:hypothetical protein
MEILKATGGILVGFMMLLTLDPFNDTVQGFAITNPSNFIYTGIAEVFPYFYTGLMFIVFAFSLYEIIKGMD